MTRTPYEPVRPESLDDVNLLDHGTQNCPYHAYELLRNEAPVWKDPVTGFYVITRFEDLRPLLRDTDTFLNSMSGGQGGGRNRLDEERAARMQALYKEKG